MYTVIVVDDEEDLRRGLIRKIEWEKIGFQVIGEAENGFEALELVEKLEPDLLLTDVKMPFMTGIELARHVREVRPTIQIAFLSGYDDFSYAQQAIQYNIVSYMLKPISSKELTEELTKIKKIIDDKFQAFSGSAEIREKADITDFLMPLVLDGFQGSDSLERSEILVKRAIECGLIGESKNSPRYTVIVTSFWDEENKNCTMRENIHAVDLVVKKYIKSVSFFVDNRIVSLIIGTKREHDKYLHILVEDLVQSVKRIMSLDATIGISREITDLQHCHEAYLEAMNAMAECNRNESLVRYISDIERTISFSHDMIEEIIGNIENKIRTGTMEELNELLIQVEQMVDRRQINLVTFRFMMIQLAATLYKQLYAIADKESMQTLQSFLPLQEQLFHMEAKDIWKKYAEYCLLVKRMISEQRTKSSSDICDRAMTVIDSHYGDADISLVSISSDIAVSPNYLSALIKKSTGRTFIELLTMKRLEVAKDLLLNSTLKIKDITEKCGYNDQHYFSYCFKKEVGISPNVFRRQNEER